MTELLELLLRHLDTSLHAPPPFPQMSSRLVTAVMITLTRPETNWLWYTVPGHTGHLVMAKLAS
jgi:hypothetical protein